MNEKLLAERDAELARRSFPEVMRSSQAARALGTTKYRVLILARDGVLESYMVGRHRRFLRLDVARFIAVGGSE